MGIDKSEQDSAPASLLELETFSDMSDLHAAAVEAALLADPQADDEEAVSYDLTALMPSKDRESNISELHELARLAHLHGILLGDPLLLKVEDPAPERHTEEEIAQVRPLARWLMAQS